VNIYTNTGHNTPHVNVYKKTGHGTPHVNVSRSSSTRVSHSASHVASHVSRGGGGGGFRSGGGGGFRSGGGGGGGHNRRSDIRLKEDIVWLGRLDNGIGIYRFRYKGSDHTAYVGVMAQEVRDIVPSAVTEDADGYLRVSYDRLGLGFMTWDAWRRRAGLR
jgi:hypothetical protein